MRSSRSVGVVLLLAAAIGLPRCGASDGHKAQSEGDAGEAGAESSSGAPGSGGSEDPGSSAGGEPGGGAPAAGAGAGGDAAYPVGGDGGVSSTLGGQGPLSGAGGDGDGGALGTGSCSVPGATCCGDEPSCDTWPGQCGQNMDSYSCCDAGVRQTCEVQYYGGNYHVVYGKEDCSCVSGGCACNCVKGSACGYNEVDCNSTSWTDSCVLGNSPTCCDSANGIRQKCEYTGGNKVVSGSVVIDACTGEGFGTGSCADCLGASDPLCGDTFSAGCSDTVSYCSDPEIGYRLSCLDGVQTVECTCDPTPGDQ